MSIFSNDGGNFLRPPSKPIFPSGISHVGSDTRMRGWKATPKPLRVHSPDLSFGRARELGRQNCELRVAKTPERERPRSQIERKLIEVSPAPLPLFPLIRLRRLSQQNTTDCVAYATETYFLAVLEAWSPRSRCWQVWFLVRTPFLPGHRWSPSHRVLTQPFSLVCVRRASALRCLFHSLKECPSCPIRAPCDLI